MSTRLQIAVVVYMVIQAMTFGMGIVVELATPLDNWATELIPGVIVVSAVLSLPIAWMIAPRLRASFWREKGIRSDFIAGSS